jgi:23S rRNA pseudouridine1911/1915/1917 synthase
MAHRRPSSRPSDTGRPTLAAWVRELSPGLSWRQARELVAAGRVTVDGIPAADPALRPDPGQRVEIAAAAAAKPAGEPEIRILHADADLAVVTKPVGLLTVPFAGDEHDTLLARARVILRRREGGDASPTLRAVQRLDKETSGVLVFARNIPAQRELQRQLAAGELTRRYLAVAHGEVQGGVCDTFFVADRGDGLRGSWGRFHPVYEEPPPGARRAVTRIAVRELLVGATLVGCTLETGRQHQIRIHLAESGHPVVGETIYIRDFRGPFLPASRLMLHAAELGLSHPRTGERLTFAAAPPPELTAFVQRRRRPGRI